MHLTANVNEMHRFLHFARNDIPLLREFCHSCLQKVITTTIIYRTIEAEPLFQREQG